MRLLLPVVAVASLLVASVGSAASAASVRTDTATSHHHRFNRFQHHAFERYKKRHCTPLRTGTGMVNRCRI